MACRLDRIWRSSMNTQTLLEFDVDAAQVRVDRARLARVRQLKA